MINHSIHHPVSHLAPIENYTLCKNDLIVHLTKPFYKNFLDFTNCRYMSDHPEYLTQGVSFSQFSFQCPRPLQENYVKKRLPRLPASVNDSPVCLPAPINDSPARFPAPVDNSSYRLPELSVNDSHAHFPDPEIVEEGALFFFLLYVF